MRIRHGSTTPLLACLASSQVLKPSCIEAVVLTALCVLLVYTTTKATLRFPNILLEGSLRLSLVVHVHALVVLCVCGVIGFERSRRRDRSVSTER